MSVSDRPVSAGAAAGAASLPVGGFVLLVLLTLFWGANWPVMKIVMQEIPVLWFRAASVGVGGAGLIIAALLSGTRIWIPRGELRPFLVSGVLAILGWHLFSGYGVYLMPAGRASIIAFTMPVWATLISTVILGEPLTRYKIAGMVLGLAGLAVLIGPEIIVLGAAPIGALVMLCAAVSWGFGTVMFKSHAWQTPIVSIVGWQLIVSAIPVTIGALIFEPMPNPATISTETWLWMLYVFALPMLFCQWAYFKIVQMFPASIAALGTLAIPIVGVYSSALLLGEPVGPRELVALALIVSALATVLVLPALRRPSA